MLLYLRLCVQANTTHKALNLLLAEATCRAIEVLRSQHVAQSFSFEEAESLSRYDAEGFCL